MVNKSFHPDARPILTIQSTPPSMQIQVTSPERLITSSDCLDTLIWATTAMRTGRWYSQESMCRIQQSQLWVRIYTWKPLDWSTMWASMLRFWLEEQTMAKFSLPMEIATHVHSQAHKITGQTWPESSSHWCIMQTVHICYSVFHHSMAIPQSALSLSDKFTSSEQSSIDKDALTQSVKHCSQYHANWLALTGYYYLYNQDIYISSRHLKADKSTDDYIIENFKSETPYPNLF